MQGISGDGWRNIHYVKCGLARERAAGRPALVSRAGAARGGFGLVSTLLKPFLDRLRKKSGAKPYRGLRIG